MILFRINYDFYRNTQILNTKIAKDMTAYQRVLLKLGTTHPTSQNSMDCQATCGLDQWENM